MGSLFEGFIRVIFGLVVYAFGEAFARNRSRPRCEFSKMHCPVVERAFGWGRSIGSPAINKNNETEITLKTFWREGEEG